MSDLATAVLAAETETASAVVDAETAAAAAAQAVLSANTLSAQVEANAAAEIAEFEADVDSLEDDVLWLRGRIADLETSLSQMATMTLSSLETMRAELAAAILLIPSQQLPLVPELEEATVDPVVAVDLPAAEIKASPKRPPRTRTLI